MATDLRGVPLIERKQRLAELLGQAEHAIQFVEHLSHDGATVFEHACRMGLEGIVSKRTDAPYRGGPSKVWLKIEEPGERGGAARARGGLGQALALTRAGADAATAPAAPPLMDAPGYWIGRNRKPTRRACRAAACRWHKAGNGLIGLND